MGTTANIFTLKLDNKDFQSQLKQAAKYSSQYNSQIANSILETARLEQKRIGLLQERAKAQAEGNKKQAQAINQEIASIGSLITAENKKIAAIKQANSYLDQNVKAINRQTAAEKQAASAIDGTTASLKKGEAARDSQFNHLIRMLRWGGTLVATYYAVNTAWTATLGRGIEVNRVIEDNTNGIAALIAANTLLITSTGQTVTAQERFTMSLGLSDQTMAKLRKAAPETAGTFEDMLTIFQQGFAQTISMGNSFGGTVEEITNNTIKLTSRMMNIAGAMGMPMDRVREEIRSLLSGNASTDSLLATMLFGSPSEANNAVKKAKELGSGALEAMLGKKLEVFDVLAQVNTYTKQLARAKDAYDTLVAEVSKPVFAGLTDAFKTFADILDQRTIEKIRKETQLLFTQFEVGGGIARDAALIILDAVENIATALYLSVGNINTLLNEVIGLVQNDLPSAFQQAQRRLTFFDYMLLGAKSAVSAIEILINYLVTEFERSMLVIEKTFNKVMYYQSQVNPTSSAYDSGKYRMAVGAAELAISKIDKKQTEFVDKKIEGLISAYKKLSAVGGVAPRKGTSSAGLLNVSQQNMAVVEEANDRIVKSKKEEVKLNEELVRYEKALAVAVKEGNTAQQESLKGAITAVKGELVELKAKSAKSAQTEANKVARAERTAFELLTLRLEKERTDRVALEALKASNFHLDVSRMTALEKLDVGQFSEKENALRQELIAAEQLEEGTNRQVKVLEIQKKINELSIAQSEHKLRVNERLTTELEKQSIAADKLARTQFAGKLDSMRSGMKTYGVETENERLFGKDKITRSTAGDLIAGARSAYYASTFSITDDKERERVRNELNKFVDDVKSKLIEIPDIQIKFDIFGGDELTKSLNSIAKIFDEVNDKTLYWDKLIVEAGKDTATVERLNEAKTQDQVKGYGQIAGAMSSMFQQGSREAAAFQVIENGLAIVAGVRAILTQGAGDPYTAFARIAAMTALVSATLSQVGIAFGSSKSVTISDAFSAMPANTGSGSVLGDTSAQSESMAKSLDILGEFAKPEFELMSRMAKSLDSIDSKIGGVSSLLLRQGGFAFGEGFSGFDTGMAMTGVMGSATSAMTSVSSAMVNVLTLGLDKLLLGGALSEMFGGIISSVMGGLFGKTSVKQTLKDSGIFFADALLTSAIDTLDGSAYQTVSTKVTKKSWFGSSSKTKVKTYFDELDSEVGRQFSLVLDTLYNTTVLAGEALDLSAQGVDSALSDFIVSIGKLSLKGKTGDQIQELLGSVFGKIADDIAGEVFPLLIPFQKVGEGLFETMTRVASGMEEAEYYINRLGNSFDDVVYSDLVNKQGDVGIEALRQSILALEGTSNGVAEVISNVTGTAEDLFSTYSALDRLRFGLIAVGTDVAALTTSMLYGAGGISALESATQSYIENFLTEAEQTAYTTNMLRDAFSDLGLTMPSTKQGFTDLLKSIDVTSETGQDLYGRVILLSEGFSDLDKAMLDSTSTIRGILASLTGAVESTSTSLQKTIDDLLDSTKGSDDPLTQYKRQFNALTSEIRGFTDASGNLLPQYEQDFTQGVSELQSLSKSILDIQTLSAGEKEGLTSTLVSELQGVKSIADITKETLSVYVENESLKIEGVTSLTQYIADAGIKPLNSFAVGSRYIPYDQTANIHQGEMIVDRSGADALRRYGVEVGATNNVDYSPLFKELSDRLSAIEKNSKVTADSTEQMAFVGVTLVEA